MHFNDSFFGPFTSHKETNEGLLKSKFVLYHCVDASIENMMSPLLWWEGT